MTNSPVKYICISDLHLGAQYSVLTKVNPQELLNFDKKTNEPSSTLQALANSIRELVPTVSDPNCPPTLLLLGDILDLSFASWPETTNTFRTFIKALFPENQPSVFAREIILIPGNHDHHLWDSVKDYWYQKELCKNNSPEFLLQVTKMFSPPSLPSKILNNILSNIDGCSDMKVVVAYPNLGLKNKDRCVILHHGHFTESTYTAMTSLANWVLKEKTPDTPYYLEWENASWIDFFWSSLGTSGTMERAGVDLYATMNNAGGAHAFTKRLAKSLISTVGANLPVGDSDVSPELPGVTLEGLVNGMLDFTVGKIAESERNAFKTVLSPSGVKGLKAYLQMLTLPRYQPGSPVEYNLSPEDTKKQVSFIFGHTHKPFQDQLITENFTQPVNVYNTGGWVLDSPKMDGTQGAAIVLVDSDLNVASLRLFNNPLNNDVFEVRAEGVGGYADTVNPLVQILKEKLKNQKDWGIFTTAFKEGVLLRARIARRAFFNPEENPPISREVS